LHLPDAVVVTTGQQPGLFTGPLYAIHKALSARALARRLERQWRRPVVPLFWLAGDDHDVREAGIARWLDDQQRLVSWRLPDRAPDAPQQPMFRERLHGAGEGVTLMRSTLPPGPARDATTEWLGRHFRDGTTMQAACGGALAELLDPFGIVCFDPTHQAFKAAQIPLLRNALQRAAELDAALAALPDAGTGISAGNGETLVFIETRAGRDRLVIEGDAFHARRSGDRYTRDALDRLLETEPERFSANVLLRPVVESALLPTVAYLGGPAEYRYQTTQAAVLYPLLGVTPQRPVRRWSGSVVEPWADRLLERLHLEADRIVHDDGRVGRGILRRDLPDDAVTAFDALRGAVDRAEPALRRTGNGIDPVLDRSVTGRFDRIRQTLDALERSFERHLKKRDDIAYAQYARLRAGLLPDGTLQERVLTAATWLGRYDRVWIDAVADATEAWCAA
jgi:bacillithiol synthase